MTAPAQQSRRLDAIPKPGLTDQGLAVGSGLLSQRDPFPPLPPGPEAAPVADFKALGRCGFCYAHLENGECVTSGCRGPGSGFEKPRVWDKAPCVKCGEATEHRVVTAIQGSGIRSVFYATYSPACPECQPLRGER